MRKVIYHPQNALISWVCAKLDMPNPGPCTAIGIVNEAGAMMAGALFNNQHLGSDGKPYMIEIAFVSVDKRWSTRANIKAIFSYPYLQLGVKRVQAITAKRNLPARRFLEKIGFRLEGIARQAWPKGGDAACYSMLRRECTWLGEDIDGERRTKSADSTGPDHDGGGANTIKPANGAIQLWA